MAVPVAQRASSSAWAPSSSCRAAASVSSCAAASCWVPAGTVMPSSRAIRTTALQPASSWKPPLLALVTLRTSGVPGTGRKPTSCGAAGASAVQ